MIFCIYDFKFKMNILIILYEYLYNDFKFNLDFGFREYFCV